MTDIKALERAINITETIKLYSILTGRYHDFVTAYLMAGKGRDRHYVNPKFHDFFEGQVLPDLQRMCGSMWGDNPRLPTHPVGIALMRKNGLI